MKFTQESKFTIELNREEMKVFYEGIGGTTHQGRVLAGMSVEQSKFFHELV